MGLFNAAFFGRMFEASTIFGGMFLDRHVYDIQTMHGMLWDMILPMRKFEFPTLARTFEFMESHKLAPFFSVFVAVYAAFTIYFLYEYHPKHIAENKEDEEKLKPIHLYAGWAISFIVPCISMLYYIYGVVRNFILHFFPQLNLPV